MACDRCSKHSYLRATKGDLELDFCRHHGLEYSLLLEATGWDLDWDTEGIAHLTPGVKVRV
jgi:hypothetical protein